MAELNQPSRDSESANAGAVMSSSASLSTRSVSLARRINKTQPAINGGAETQFGYQDGHAGEWADPEEQYAAEGLSHGIQASAHEAQPHPAAQQAHDSMVPLQAQAVQTSSQRYEKLGVCGFQRPRESRTLSTPSTRTPNRSRRRSRLSPQDT